MTERELALQQIMEIWDEECPDADPKDRSLARRLFKQGIDGMKNEDVHKLRKSWFGERRDTTLLPL